MQAQGLDCLIIYGAYSYAGTDTGLVNVVYLANYAAPLVNGWSTYNHAPHFGAITGTPDAKKRAYPKDLDFVLQPGHCVGIRSYPIAADGKTAVWMGTTCVMTAHGLEKLHACPVNKLNVAPA